MSDVPASASFSPPRQLQPAGTAAAAAAAAATANALVSPHAAPSSPVSISSSGSASTPHSPLFLPLSGSAAAASASASVSGQLPVSQPIIAVPSLAGVLWKKGSTFGSWSARFYRLQGDPTATGTSSRLLYSKTAEGPVRGEVSLAGRFTVTDLVAEAQAVTGASLAAAKQQYAGQFRIDLPNRNHVLRCDDLAQLPAWILALQALSRANNESRRKGSLPDAAATSASMGTAAGAGSSSSATPAISIGSASHCSGCDKRFDLLRSGKFVCGGCGLVFCGSLGCMEPMSLTSREARCCLSCAEARGPNTPSNVTGLGGTSSSSSSPPFLSKKGSLARMGSTLNITGGTSGGGGGGSSTQLQLQQQYLYRPSNANLLIRVLSGRHLMVCDASGSSDPYAVIFFEGAEYRTEVVEQSLDPVWNAQFNLPVTGSARDVQIGVYDSDRYSNDDFMGMVHIPLSQLSCDKVYEDWFPLKPRPGKSSDKDLAISGAIHLQLVLSESLFSLFAPIVANQAEPEEAYAQAVLTHHIRRVGALVESLQLGGVQMVVEDVLSYKRPLQSIVALVFVQALVLFFPAEWILPAIPLLLLVQMALGFLARQEAVVAALEAGSDYHTALLQARNSDALRRKEQRQRRLANSRALARSNRASRGQEEDPLLDDPYAASSGPFSPRAAALAAAAAAAQHSAALDDEEDEEEELAAAASAEAEAASLEQLALTAGTAGTVTGSAEAQGGGGDDDDDDEDGGDGDDEKRRALGFMDKMRRYQKQLAKVQTVIGKLCDKIEAVQNLFRWHDVRRSKLIAAVLLLAFVFLLLVPFRLLLCAGVTARWAKTLLQALKKRKQQRRAMEALKQQQQQGASASGAFASVAAAAVGPAAAAAAGGKKASEVDNFLQRAQTATSLNPTKLQLVEKLRKS